jgi:uncharacterized protein (TIGR03437 family)
VQKTLFALALAVCSQVLCPNAQAQTNGITLSPAAFTINYQIGATALPAAQTMQVQTTPKALNFTLAISGAPFNAAWLLVSATAGVSPGSIKIEVNPTGLAAGTYAGVITATASSAGTVYTQTASVTLLVASPAPTISATPPALTFSYTTGSPIPAASLTSSFILSSSGSALPATVSVSGATWLTVSPTGNISLVGLLNTLSVTVNPTGLTPKVYTGTIKISAPNATNKTLSVTVTLTVNAAVPTVTATWPAGVIQGSTASTVTLDGAGYFSNSTVAASGFTPASTITVTDGTSTVSSTFLISAYQSTVTVLRLGVASPMPSGAVGVAYSQPLAGAGGTAPYAYAITAGFAPTGLAVAGTNLAGTPSAAGTYLFTIQVTDSSTPPAQAFSQVALTIDPTPNALLTIEGSAAPLPLGTVAAAYGPVSLVAAGGTGGPYTWTATDLPAGLSLSSAGVLSGTPSTDGSSGAIAATIVSDSSLLATVPAIALANPGVLRLAVNTPAPGGGSSNEGPFQVYGPNPQITAVVNSASYIQGTLAPGDVIAIFGLGLGPSMLTIFDPTVLPIPAVLPSVAPSTSVSINGTLAPILYTSATTVGVIVPYTTTGPTAQVIVSFGGLVSQAFTVAVAAADPGIYSLAASGQGQGAILNFNTTTGVYTINAAATPAPAGSEIVVYLTGVGPTTSAVDDQLIPASPAVTPTQLPSVSIGGQGATLLAAQAPIGSVPGLMQLNVTVPTGLKSGPSIPIIVTVAGISSQTGLTMAVK